MAKTKEFISDLMVEKIVYHRFTDIESLTKRISEKIEPSVNLQEAELTDEEVMEIGCDYQLDGTFGENKYGMAYADFVINYLKDNSDNMFVTGFSWM